MCKRYEFRTTDGSPCCSTNDRAHLCPACKVRAAREADQIPDPYARVMSPPVAVLTNEDGVPDGYATALQRAK